MALADLLIVGGSADPNLESLAQAAAARKLDLLDLRIGSGQGPGFSWNLDHDTMLIDGRPASARGAFVRFDVFASMSDPRRQVSHRSLAWHDSLLGWLLAHREVRMFNRGMAQVAASKPYQLSIARRMGLKVPPTLVTNEIGALRRETGDRIAKPVSGGGFCRRLDDAASEMGDSLDIAAAPAIVQPRLPAPEVRIYLVGEQAFAFDLQSDAVDYRVTQDVEVTERPIAHLPMQGVRRLLRHMGMDFGAADFRTDPSTGELVFLELNTSPMFARFNAVTAGRLCAAMVDTLVSDAARLQRFA